MAKIDNLFHLLHANHGSDLHLSAGNPPLLRIYGDLARVDAPVVTTEELLAVLREMVPMERVQAFEQTGDLDFAYDIPGLARYRANFFRQNRGISAVFREIPQRISTVEELGLPIMLRELALLPKGLVLVTGPTGSGKSTALRSALREDPDIILVGEMRDLETISLALEAAETGHLVFATLHTISAPKTIDRIIEVFPPEEQAQIRTSLSESIQAIIAQTLFKRADKKGRVPALEIMFGIPSVRNMIRESKTFQLPSVLQTNRNVGMQTMDDDIERLLMQRIIAPEAALVHAQDKGRLREAIGKLK